MIRSGFKWLTLSLIHDFDDVHSYTEVSFNELVFGTCTSPMGMHNAHVHSLLLMSTQIHIYMHTYGQTHPTTSRGHTTPITDSASEKRCEPEQDCLILAMIKRGTKPNVNLTGSKSVYVVLCLYVHAYMHAYMHGLISAVKPLMNWMAQ